MARTRTITATLPPPDEMTEPAPALDRPARPKSPLFKAPTTPEPDDSPTMPAAEPGPAPLSSPSGPGRIVGDGGVSGTHSTPPKRITKAQLRPAVERGVLMIGGVLQALLTAPDSPERVYGVWIPDETDTKEISDPAASIAQRRLPAGTGNPDLMDGIVLAFAVFGYVVKQLQRRAEIRAAGHYRAETGPGAGGGAHDPAFPPVDDQGPTTDPAAGLGPVVAAGPDLGP